MHLRHWWHTNTSLHWWPLLALIHLASSQMFERCNVLDHHQQHCPHRREQNVGPPVLAVLAIRSNQCYHLHFPVMGKYPFCLEEHTHTHTWPAAKGWGPSAGTAHDAFSFSMYVQLPVHMQWEMFNLPKRKTGHISSLTPPHEKGVHILWGVPADTHHISSQWLLTFT